MEQIENTLRWTTKKAWWTICKKPNHPRLFSCHKHSPKQNTTEATTWNADACRPFCLWSFLFFFPFFERIRKRLHYTSTKAVFLRERWLGSGQESLQLHGWTRGFSAGSFNKDVSPSHVAGGLWLNKWSPEEQFIFTFIEIHTKKHI